MPPSTKVQVVLDIEYDLAPNRKNKIDIQKVLALELFRLGDEDNCKLSWADVPILDYRFKIFTNPMKYRTKKPQPHKPKIQNKGKPTS